MRTLRVGLAGAGGIAQHHVQAWEANAPRGQIVAIADVATERAHLLRASLRDSDVPLFPDLAAMLAGAELDAVDLCLPHHLHAEAIVAAARAGKAILSEKPLCTTLAEAATIGEALAASGVTFMMAHNQLFQPSLIAARQLLAEGAIGRPFVIRSNETFRNQGIIDADLEAAAREGDGPWAWRADPRQMGGGEVIDTGWHASYRLLALAGDDRPVEVAAMMGRFAVPAFSGEDTGALLVRFASGAIGEMLTSWASPVGDRQFEIAGELGSLAGGGNDLVYQRHGDASRTTWSYAPVHTFTAEVTHFLDVVQGDLPSLASFAQAARVLQLTLAAYDAAANRRSVLLPEDPIAPGIPAT